MTAPNYDYVYQPGGSLGFRAPSYVPRQADDDLYEGIKSGRFCYVFNCRQMGKSSLRVRVSKRLEQDGYRCAALDLTALGGDEHLTPAQWYRSLITELNRSLSLLSVAEFDAWLAASDGLTAVYALSQFIEDVVLAKTAEQPVVIFIDEIDNVLSLSFDTTDLFAVIRNCYNKRADNPDYERLNFSLFGVATPAKLMRDTSRTPFNIGKAIRLMPLDLAQAKPLENGLVGWAESPEQVLRAIFEWTGGQPYLTQRLCELVQDEGMAHGAMPSSDTAAKVAELAEKNILTNWQLQDEQNHLKTIQDRLLRQSNLINRVVDLYGQVLEKGEISVTSNDEATVELRLSGIVVEEAQKLRSFNRIYRCVFGSDWVTKTLGDLRPHSTMFESWVASGSNARDHLLRGEMLKVAEAWAEGKSLSDLDNRYLRESQKAENMTFRKWAQASTLVSGIVAVGMLLAATTSYKAYIDIEEKVTVSQLQVTTNVSKNFLLENKPMEALVAAVKGGQIVKEKSLQSSQGGAIVLAALHQARYSSRNPNVQGASSFQEYNRLSVHSDGVSSMSFSPDGETLASASYDGTVKLWSIAGEQLETLSGHSDEVYRMSFSPDGETLASASGDGTVKLWSIAGEQLETLSGHSDRVHSVSFSPDGETLASASGDGTVKLWSIAGEQLETLSGHSDRVYGVSFSPDGETLASASYDGTVKLWSIAGEQLETLSGHSDRVSSVSFSPDGETLASASTDGTVKLWSIAGEQLETLSGHSSWVYGVSFSPDGETLASASGDGTVKLWSIAGEQLETLSGHSDEVYGVSFSPDGEILASAGRDGMVKLWSIAGEQLETLSGHSLGVSSMSFSPDGETLASASRDGTVKLWSIAGEQLETLSGHSDRVHSVSFSPDGETLASASYDGTVKLWSIAGEQLETLSGHSDRVSSVSFSPDGETLASASTDGTVKLWSIAGEQLETLSGHSSWVYGVSFSPDGETLASASGDGTVKLWDRNLEHLLTSSCEWLTPYLRNNPEGQQAAKEGVCKEYL